MGVAIGSHGLNQVDKSGSTSVSYDALAEHALKDCVREEGHGVLCSVKSILSLSGGIETLITNAPNMCQTSPTAFIYTE